MVNNGSGWTAPKGTAALIFDCDGTLADTMPAHFQAWSAMVAEHGIAFSEEQFYAFAGMPSNRIIDRLAAEQGRFVDAHVVTSMVVDKEHRYIEMIDLVRPVDVVVDIASRHRGVVPMAVASGGEGWVVRRTLDVIGVLEWFDTVVGSDDTERHKPEPDVFLEAAQRLAAEPARCVVFEDSDLGIEAARRAGMHGIDIRLWLRGSSVES